MDRYALDANAIAEDYLLERNPARLLLREAREGRIELIAPQVAIDEAVNKYREEIEERFREARRAKRRLQGLRAIDQSQAAFELSTDDATTAYEQLLTDTLTAAGAEVLGYPAVAHEDVTKRALERRRPFDPEGKDGYRDTLVWETLVEHANDQDTIVLVTGDNDAFGKKDGLRTELQEELEARGLPRGSIRRIHRIADFTDTLPSVPQHQLEFEHVVSSPGHVREAFLAGVEEEALDWDEAQPASLGLDVEVDHVYMDSVRDVRNVKVIAARELEDGTVALELEADIEASLEVYVRKSDVYSSRADDLRITDHDYNESFAEGIVDRVIRAEIEARYDTRTHELDWALPYNFLSFEPVGS